MNHLCGLPNLEGENALPNDLTDGERGALAAFRRRYDDALRQEYTKNGRVAADEGRKDPSSPPPPPPVPFAMPTYELSDEQVLTPSGLRPLDDLTLYRYLLADRQADGAFDVGSSYQRLLGALRFRQLRKSDLIVRHVTSSTVPANIKKMQRLRVAIWVGVDRQSRPVVFERVGQFMEKGNAGKVPQEEWITSYLYFLETHFFKMRESAKRSGKAVDRIVYFADFQGVVSSILNRKVWKAVPLLKSLANSVECHYPELVDHILLFNVPKIASAVFKVVKGFLDPVTSEKIEVFGGVPYDRFKQLLDKEVIPVEYGGKNQIQYPQTLAL